MEIAACPAISRVICEVDADISTSPSRKMTLFSSSFEIGMEKGTLTPWKHRMKEKNIAFGQEPAQHHIKRPKKYHSRIYT